MELLTKRGGGPCPFSAAGPASLRPGPPPPAAPASPWTPWATGSCFSFLRSTGSPEELKPSNSSRGCPCRSRRWSRAESLRTKGQDSA